MEIEFTLKSDSLEEFRDFITGINNRNIEEIKRLINIMAMTQEELDAKVSRLEQAAMSSVESTNELKDKIEEEIAQVREFMATMPKKLDSTKLDAALANIEAAVAKSDEIADKVSAIFEQPIEATPAPAEQTSNTENTTSTETNEDAAADEPTTESTDETGTTSDDATGTDTDAATSTEANVPTTTTETDVADNTDTSAPVAETSENADQSSTETTTTDENLNADRVPPANDGSGDAVADGVDPATLPQPETQGSEPNTGLTDENGVPNVLRTR